MTYEPKIKIDVTRDVHEHLRGLKKKGDSFNDVLRRELLEERCEKCKEFTAQCYCD